MKSRKLNLLIAALLSGAVVASGAFAKGPGSGGGGGGETTAVNNISFPVILSDNVGPALPLDGAWKFADITDPTTQCIGEAGVVSGAVDPSIVCYYGRQVTVNSETKTISFVDGTTRVWWLQQRAPNFWKALTIGHDVSTPLVVSAVDVGDLLESTPSISTRQIRTEFNMLQHVPADDAELGAKVVTDWTSLVPPPCVVPAATGDNLGCFAALAMSGPVPGTQQTINEIQGTDFGPGTGTYPGTRALVDPSTVKTTTPDVGGIQAVVYSRCARLLIQKIDGTPTWNPSTGQWAGAGVGAPVVNIAAYTDAYSAEINSGGSLVYGYNWNAKTAATGTYRLTFVLDGNDAVGPQCPTTLATVFDPSVTQLVNVGENNPSHIIYKGDSQLGDEGGLAYIDMTLSTKGGGGGGSGGKPTR